MHHSSVSARDNQIPTFRSSERRPWRRAPRLNYADGVDMSWSLSGKVEGWYLISSDVTHRERSKGRLRWRRVSACSSTGTLGSASCQFCCLNASSMAWHNPMHTWLVKCTHRGVMGDALISQAWFSVSKHPLNKIYSRNKIVIFLYRECILN